MKGNWLKIAAGVLAVAVIALVLVMVPGRSGQTEILRVATTTSLYDTGLWDHLEIIFEDRYDVDLQITAKGTGASLELGKNGDVDVVTVHDPLKEAAFIDGGYGVEAEINGNAMERIPWAYNYYIIIGSEADPAGIGGGNLTPEEACRGGHLIRIPLNLSPEGMSRGLTARKKPSGHQLAIITQQLLRVMGQMMTGISKLGKAWELHCR